MIGIAILIEVGVLHLVGEDFLVLNGLRVAGGEGVSNGLLYTLCEINRVTAAVRHVWFRWNSTRTCV